jgi:hypothetical protein
MEKLTGNSSPRALSLGTNHNKTWESYHSLIKGTHLDRGR